MVSSAEKAFYVIIIAFVWLTILSMTSLLSRWQMIASDLFWDQTMASYVSFSLCIGIDYHIDYFSIFYGVEGIERWNYFELLSTTHSRMAGSAFFLKMAARMISPSLHELLSFLFF